MDIRVWTGRTYSNRVVFSQWSDYGNDSESNLGFEYESIFQNDYGVDFRSDSEIASVSEFDIETETESKIASLIDRKSKNLI